MKILFLNPPFLPRFSRSQRSPAVTKSGTLYYPLWLAYAAGAAEQAGFEVKLIDSPAERMTPEEIYKLIEDFSPRLAVIDTSTPTIYNDIDVAQRIKTILPDCYTVLVGTHVSTLPEETLTLGKTVDAIARGEYDSTILEVANAIKSNTNNFHAIAGLTFQSAGQIINTPDRTFIPDLDALPFVSSVYKKHLNIRNYFFGASLYPEVQILTARGCPFQCFFCLWPQAFQTRTYRTRSPENVVDEFLFIKHNLPEVKGIVIEDDTFTVDIQRVRRICASIIQNKAVIPWNANVRTNLDAETMRLMKRAGCYLLITGIESTDQTILNNINKGLKANDIQKFFDNAKRLGLLVHAAFMVGNPGETEEILRNNLRLAKKFLPDTVQFFPLMPYPGTAAYRWAKENGYLRINSYRDYITQNGLHNCVIDLPGLSREKIMAWCETSRRSFYLTPRYLFYKLMQTITRPDQVLRSYKGMRNYLKYIMRT